MQRYYILLKATGAGGWPGWLPYRLDADSAEQAVEKKPRSRPRIITRSTKSLKFRLSKSKGEANEAGSNRKAH